MPSRDGAYVHGLTLEAIVTALAEGYGWDGLSERIPVRCFSPAASNTTSASSQLATETPNNSVTSKVTSEVKSIYNRAVNALTGGGK